MQESVLKRNRQEKDGRSERMRRWRENRRYGKRQGKRQGMTFLLLILFLAFPIKGMAEEMDPEESTVPETGDNPVALPETDDRKFLSVEPPIPEEGENSPFDFVLDPYELLYRTGAEKYGGGSVEEGATLLFRNRDGEYAFSSCSDDLTVVNQGEQPVAVTVSATIRGLEGMELASDDDFSESGGEAIYLALIDETGRTQPLSAEGEVSVSQVVKPGSWSIRLIGACNPDADWQRMTFVYPRISVRWYVESEEEPEGDANQNNPGEEEGGKKENVDSVEPSEEVGSTGEPSEEAGSTGEPSEDTDLTEEPENFAETENSGEPSEKSAGSDSGNQDEEISVSGNDSFS